MCVILLMMKKNKIALVGCGNIGKRHLAILDASSSFEIVGICDLKHDVLTSQAKLYNYFETFLNYQEMLKKVNADILAICTPHDLHREMSIAALQSGFDVLCEKPMAMNESQCKEMNKVQKQTNQNLWVVHQNRYNVPIKYTKEAIDLGKLGNIFMVQCNVVWNRNNDYYDQSSWRGNKSTEGGALYTQASHFVDLLTWWFGNVSKAQAKVDTKNHSIEIEDCGISNLTFSSGVMGSLLWTTNAYSKNYEGSITIISEKGTIKIGGRYLNQIDYWDVEDYPLPENIDFSDKPNTYDKYKGSSSNHDKLYDEISKYYRGQPFDLVSGEEAMKTSQAIELIYKSVG